VKPLAGVKVLDLSRVLAGPWCTQLLADLGAEVTKVERPGAGDDTRHWGPPWHGEGDRRVAAYFLSCNRGKKSAAIDFAQPEGAALVRQLAAGADIVVENFKVGGLKKFGLDAASLRTADPRLIYASITGFGQDGPYAGRAGYDFIIQGMGGMMSVTGLPDDEPGGGPMRAGVAIADLFTGMYTCVSIIAALYGRERSGEGATIDMALFDTQLAVMANQASNALISGKDPPRQGNTHPNIVPYQPFDAADQPIIIAVGNDATVFKGQTVRLLITNVQTLQERKPVIERFMKAYRETIDWLYSDDPAALKTYADFVGISVATAKRTRDGFFPKAAVDPDAVVGLDQIMQDAVTLKYTAAQLTKEQLAELIQIPPRR